MSRLHYAARRAMLVELQAAIASGDDPNGRTSLHFTPLHLAAQEGHAPIAAAFLDAGADPLLAHPNGRTALHFAASGGYLDVVRLLVERGVPVDLKTKGGTTPALEAAEFDRRETARYLLDHGADPNATNRLGKTVTEWLEIGGVMGQHAEGMARFSIRTPAKDASDIAALRKLMARAPSVEAYAAQHGRQILIFGYGRYDLPDLEVDRWARRLAEILASPALLAECEDRHLQGEELAGRRRLRERQARAAERRRLRDERRAQANG